MDTTDTTTVNEAPANANAHKPKTKRAPRKRPETPMLARAVRGKVLADQPTYRPETIAAAFGVSGKVLRGKLRVAFGDTHEKNSAWNLTHEQAEYLLAGSIIGETMIANAIAARAKRAK